MSTQIFFWKKEIFRFRVIFVSDLDLVPGDLRLLTVDNIPLIPANVHVSFFSYCCGCFA